MLPECILQQPQPPTQETPTLNAVPEGAIIAFYLDMTIRNALRKRRNPPMRR